MNLVVIIILLYFAIGIVLVLWDFRKILFSYKKEHTASSLYIEPPKFLGNLTVGTAFIFILIWPIKLIRKSKF